MEAVVLAGGYATRMWPVTRHRPKMLLPVGETTVIDRILTELEADDRIDRVLISTNERFAEDFRTHVERAGYEKPTLSIEDTTEEDEKFGVVGALAQLVDRECVDDDLLVVAGDNLMGFPIGAFIDFYLEDPAPTLAAYDVGSRDRARSYGVIDVDGDRVLALEEKPDDPPSTLVSIACYLFPRESLRFDEYLAGENNPDEPGWYLQWLVDREPVRAYDFDAPWFDIGTPAAYLEAVAWALDGEHRIADGATVEDSTIGPNVHVMADAVVRDATVENAVVFPDATIEDATVRATVVDEHAHVADATLTDSLIGPHSRVIGDD